MSNIAFIEALNRSFSTPNSLKEAGEAARTEEDKVLVGETAVRSLNALVSLLDPLKAAISEDAIVVTRVARWAGPVAAAGAAVYDAIKAVNEIQSSEKGNRLSEKTARSLLGSLVGLGSGVALTAFGAVAAPVVVGTIAGGLATSIVLTYSSSVSAEKPRPSGRGGKTRVSPWKAASCLKVCYNLA